MANRQSFDFHALFGSLTIEVQEWLRGKIQSREKIPYFIAQDPVEASQDFWAIGALEGDGSFIESLIKRVDAAIDLDFVRVSSLRMP